MAVVSRFKSPHCLESHRKSIEPSLCPRCCQKQQVAMILRFFTLTPTPADYLQFPQRLTSVAPAGFPPQISFKALSEMSGWHLAIIQLGCYTLEIEIQLLFFTFILKVRIMLVCQFPVLVCILHTSPVNIGSDILHQVLFMYFADFIYVLFIPRLRTLRNSRVCHRGCVLTLVCEVMQVMTERACGCMPACVYCMHAGIRVKLVLGLYVFGEVCV